MTKKLTLTIDSDVIKSAKNYASENNISLSKLVEHYFKMISNPTETHIENIPPITRELAGIARMETKKSDKELLREALNKKFL